MLYNDYTVEVRYRFKRLDLIEYLKSMDRGLDIVQEAGIKTITKKKEMQKGKMAV